MNTPRLTILFDNYAFRPGLATLWGFAAVIHLPAQTILFDTGSNGRVLLKNMAALGIDPGAVDMLFLSHPHWDHIGGLDSFLEVNPTVAVVVHEDFSKHLIRDLDTLCGELIVVGADSRQLAPGVFFTGMLDSEPPEQATRTDCPEAQREVAFGTGSAAHEIARYAAANDVDLIVVASHGHKGITASLGSTARAVQQHATCEVILVPAEVDSGAAEKERRLGRS
ncbi:MAG: universal stress protein [Pseudomonadota bacterium]|nr:universal stress protein [Pseudomonadota bacterium]